MSSRLEFTCADSEFELRQHWTGSLLDSREPVVETVSDPIAMISIARANEIIREKLKSCRRVYFGKWTNRWANATCEREANSVETALLLDETLL